MSQSPEENLEKRLLIYHLLITGIGFAGYLVWFRTPLIFDDYRYLIASYSPGFNIHSLGPFLSRVPTYGVLLFTFLKLDFLTDRLYLFLFLHFLVHSASLFLVCKFVCNTANNQKPTALPPKPWLFLALTSTLAFYPNFMEVLLWPNAAVYTWGGLFMGIALHSRQKATQYLFFLLSFSTYETYILPSICLVLFREFQNKSWQNGLNATIKSIGIPLLSLLTFVVLRIFLSSVSGQYHQEISTNFGANLHRIFKYLVFIQNMDDPQIRMYAYEPVFTVSTLLFLWFLDRHFLLRKILPLIFLLVLSCGIDLVVGYDALRVLQGSFLMKAGILTTIFVHLSGLRTQLRYFSATYIGMMIVLSSINLYQIGKVRILDNLVFKRLENRLLQFEKYDKISQTVVIASLDHDFNPLDWVIDPFNSQMPIDILKYQHKNLARLRVAFQDDGYDKRTDLAWPVTYTPNSFVFDLSRILFSDDQALTGEVLEIPAGVTYNFGPYISLLRGEYTLEISVDNKDAEMNQFEKLLVAYADSGRKEIPVLSTHSPANTGKFSSYSFHFQVNEDCTGVGFKIMPTSKTIHLQYIRLNRKI